MQGLKKNFSFFIFIFLLGIINFIPTKSYADWETPNCGTYLIGSGAQTGCSTIVGNVAANQALPICSAAMHAWATGQGMSVIDDNPKTNCVTAGTYCQVKVTNGWDFGGIVMLCNPSPIDGTCGIANGGTFPVAPSTDLCGNGDGIATPAPSGAGPWSWTCGGTGGGVPSPVCTATQAAAPINGACGTSAGVPTTVSPTTGLCNAGNATAVSLAANIFSWTCQGIAGGSDMPCTAPEMVHGQCGPADGTPTGSAPAAGLCNAGTASALAGAGPWTWTCIGINTGSTQSCTAPLPPPPPTFGGACPT